MKTRLATIAFVGCLVTAAFQMAVYSEIVIAAEQAQSMSVLEKLFLDKEYETFFPAARQAADVNDPEALFLLGKAYHLGAGVDQDAAEAAEYYVRAAKLGSARAWHNLGLIQQDEGLFVTAKESFETALSLGLKTPTLYVLGELHMNYFQQMAGRMTPRLACQLLRDAASYFFQSNALAPSDQTLLRLVSANVLIYRNRHIHPSCDGDSALAVANEHLDTAESRNFPWAYYYQGLIQLESGYVVQAVRLLRKAADAENGDAAYLLGKIYLEGNSDIHVDKTQALHWLTIATTHSGRGHVDVDRLWKERFEKSETARDLEQLLDDMASLKLASRYVPWSVVESATKRLKFRRILERNASSPVQLTNQDIQINVCYTDVPGPKGVPFPGARWRIVSLSESSSELSAVAALPILEGVTGKNGCIRLTPIQKALLKDTISQGRTLAWVADSHAVILDVELPAMPTKFVFSPYLILY